MDASKLGQRSRQGTGRRAEMGMVSAAGLAAAVPALSLPRFTRNQLWGTACSAICCIAVSQSQYNDPRTV